ncbi:MAG: SRPBCC domain-containing protein [Acidobacteria bacterium]|nr:SRPBCC domain-containing protein [Acidobacteriota bacterium]
MRIGPVKGNGLETQKRPGTTPGSKITKRVWIKATIETVYKALTDSKELAQWFCDRASCDASERKELVAYWKTGKSVQKGHALFTRVIPESLLELVWIDDGSGEQEQKPSHTLSYEIRSKSDMTELIMIDSDDSNPDEETREILDLGWNSVLLELKDHCERKERLAKPRRVPLTRSQKAPED